MLSDVGCVCVIHVRMCQFEVLYGCDISRITNPWVRFGDDWQGFPFRAPLRFQITNPNLNQKVEIFAEGPDQNEMLWWNWHLCRFVK